MPRIADVRPPAAPVSQEQAARQERILDAAARLAAADGLEHVQMHDVARAAEVAIGTLYRYFPSKTQLFAATFRWRLRTLLATRQGPAAADAVESVGDTLIEISRALLGQPLLASAMMQSAVIEATSAPRPAAGAVESVLGVAVLEQLGVTEPTADDLARARFLVFSWWGVLVSVINDAIPDERIADELRLAARVTLAHYADRRPSHDQHR
jgi:AcrR family transcriptional regulator